MENFFRRKINFFYFVLFILSISSIYAKYKEFELKLKKGETNKDFPLYIETKDSCSKWVPSLFSSLLIINNTIEPNNHSITMMEINLQNPYSKKSHEIPLKMDIFLADISIFNNIYLAKSRASWPQYCLFGLDYSDVLVNNQNINSIKNLIPKQIEKNIFSFGKWDISKNDYIHSKFYIGDSHENFLEDVGTCKIQNDSNYYGCIFKDFVFLNETYPLINEKNNSYIIYFSTEFNRIYFPNSFENIIKNCHLQKNLPHEFICEELKNKDYLPLILRNDNMNITLEVDRINRFYSYSPSSEAVTNIFFHDLDYIIFPLTMLKNFHTQFDVDKKIISFYSNDTTILEIKRKEPPKTEEPEKDDDSGGISTWLLVILIILGILLICGIGYGGFLFYRKRNLNLEQKFNKYSRFEDEDSTHALVN